MTIKELMDKATIELKTKEIETPKLKARLLMQFILDQPRQYIVVNDDQELTKSQEEKYFHNLQKLIKGIPIQHITHRQEFMKMDFYVNKHVLIPRPDTEILVEEVIKIANKIQAKRILDLCTGSGAIAISLAKYIKNSRITAIDISHEAIEVAKRNAKKNEVEHQIQFIESDLFEKLTKEKFDIIVSNPPYIKTAVIQTLDKEVQEEPEIALNGGEDGLEFYRKIIPKAWEFLKDKGYLCLEIGYDQKMEVMNLIEQEDRYVDTNCKKDLYGKDRVMITKVGS